MDSQKNSAKLLGCCATALAATFLMTSTALAETCAAPSVHAVREFSVHRNSVCILKRKEMIAGEKFLEYRLDQPPKLGHFGTVNLYDFAYRAGNVAGDDYFEYTSIETINGSRQEFRVRNTVHVLP